MSLFALEFDATCWLLFWVFFRVDIVVWYKACVCVAHTVVPASRYGLHSYRLCSLAQVEIGGKILLCMCVMWRIRCFVRQDKKPTHIHPAVVVNIFQNPSNVECRKLKTGDMRNLLTPTILSALTVLLSVTTVTGESFNFWTLISSKRS